MNITLTCTCYACPEQYDAHDQTGRQVGYLRLRGGRFRADVPDVRGQSVYIANTAGDGRFTDDERVGHIQAACAAIAAAHREPLNGITVQDGYDAP